MSASSSQLPRQSISDDPPSYETSGYPPSYEDVEAARRAAEQAVISDDGRIDIDLNSRLSRTLSRIIKLPPLQTGAEAEVSPPHAHEQPCKKFPLHLSLVIQVVGSRGDVQPFLALGSALLKQGHRVRLATHATFRDFVQNAGLEFYPIGGDPKELIAYMVDNPGLVPSAKTLRGGQVSRKRKMMSDMLNGCWKSCVEPDIDTGRPFVADAVIANPPSFAHIHCAEALGVPLHMMFTMPWTGTRDFPHPLANVTTSQHDRNLTNYLSYAVVEWMTWQGLGDIINTFRQGLGLEPIPRTEGPMLTETLKIPHTYCWSAALVPKPLDWPAHIDVCGFVFRDSPEYHPPEGLRKFLGAGPPPIYIGFGSIVAEDPVALSSMIVRAVEGCGIRAVIARGWSGLSGPETASIFWIDDCPHEWLFKHVFAVVHHGGAGTTACGLLNAKPSIIVPFFGDQAFWGSMVAAAGAGPTPIPHRQLNEQRLAAAIEFCKSKEARSAAYTLSAQIRREKGVDAAVRSIHANLPVHSMRCDFIQDQPASFTVKISGRAAKISKLAAAIMIEDLALDPHALRHYQSSATLIENHRWDPLTGTASSVLSTASGVVKAATGIFLEPAAAYTRDRSRSSSGRRDKVTARSVESLTSTDLSAAADDASVSSGVSGTRFERTSAISRASSMISESTKHRLSTSNGHLASQMALASGKSFGKILSTYSKGILVDMPLATAEGFRSMPHLWGSDVRDYGKVTDWRSGAIVASKSLIHGVRDGFQDLVTEPVIGGQRNGAWGATKGIAKGTASLLTKAVTGGVGLVAYPGQGISKSIHTWSHGSIRKHIREVRLADGRRMLAQLSGEKRSTAVAACYSAMREKPS